MKVSIITVCWNSAKTIADTITSVDQQTYSDIEHIIVDGKSSDNTLDIVKGCKGRVTKVHSEEDEGLYDAMNKGIGLASGDIIGILNSDDIYANEFVIEGVVHSFASNKVDAVFGDIAFVKEDDISSVVRVWRSNSHVKGSFVSGWHPPHPGLFLSAHCYQEYGVFRTDISVSADFELMLRMFEKCNISSLYVPGISVMMRLGGESTASLRQIFNGNINVLRAFKLNGFKIFPPFYVLKRFWSKLLQYVGDKDD